MLHFFQFIKIDDDWNFSETVFWRKKSQEKQMQEIKINQNWINVEKEMITIVMNNLVCRVDRDCYERDNYRNFQCYISIVQEWHFKDGILFKCFENSNRFFIFLNWEIS